MKEEFRRNLHEELASLLEQGSASIPERDRLRIDLHCHDRHSDRPDERLGRLLGVPETWVTTEQVLDTLEENGTDLVTITNHNDARACWKLLDKGRDILPGAEFSCKLPDFDVGIHVLAYGFTPQQEERLQRLRRDVYRFTAYCAEHDIPTVLAHPLQFHSPTGLPPMEVMDRLGLLFERFEVVNGQRDLWQNMLTASWVRGMDQEEIEAMARRTRQTPGQFVRDPWRKAMTGGSDDHMAMFAGSTGTILGIPGLAEARKGGRKLSDLALQAIRDCRVAPYGGANHEEKLAAALLYYFCQVVLNMEDPGLLRLLLHKGDTGEKILGLLVANGVFEMRRHRTTMQFLTVVHEAFAGKAPGFIARMATSKDFRPLLDRLSGIAAARRRGSRELAREVDTALPDIFRELGAILARRARKRGPLLDAIVSGGESDRPWIERMELPADLRRLMAGTPRDGQQQEASSPSFAKVVDGLPYPLLAALVIGGSSYAASRVLHEKRPFLDAFAERIGKHRHPKRALWLTDTFEDRNGVSSALRALLDEVRARDLPIDLCVVSDTIVEEPHLRVLRPVAVFESGIYPQPLRIPDLLEVQKLFQRGAYDRVVCSTEGPMGAVAIYLKHAFEVPAWFFAHTDWIDFARTSLAWDRASISRLRRILRTFYRGFDGLFVLNSEMREWFAGPQMSIPSDRLHGTAHWVEDGFRPVDAKRSDVFPGVADDEPLLLFAGRLSDEKGVRDLAPILRRVRERVPRARLALAGTGPSAEAFRAEIPDAVFLGWCDHGKLAAAYSCADLLVLPSRFDTFGCVVIEAMACGLPVAAYAVKGPRDIVEPGISGILGDSVAELSMRIADTLLEPARMALLRDGALARAKRYDADPILAKLVDDLGLGERPLARPEANRKGDGGLLAEIMGIVQEA